MVYKESPRRGCRCKTPTFTNVLYSAENLPDKYPPALETLKELNLKVGRAWAIKESLRSLWEYSHEGWARRFFKQWFAWAAHCRLEPIRKVAKCFAIILTISLLTAAIE